MDPEVKRISDEIWERYRDYLDYHFIQVIVDEVIDLYRNHSINERHREVQSRGFER